MATPAIFMIKKRTYVRFIILSLQCVEIFLIRNNILTIIKNSYRKNVDTDEE